jgi:uncharacterized oligopeptide transporter (OPT) family protein
MRDPNMFIDPTLHRLITTKQTGFIDSRPLLPNSAATSGSHFSVAHAQKINLVAAGLASGSADVATSLTSDFRTGFLLGTPPVKQFVAQAIGIFVSVWLAPGMFVLFTTAYPCIIDSSITTKCAFNIPSVSA